MFFVSLYPVDILVVYFGPSWVPSFICYNTIGGFPGFGGIFSPIITHDLDCGFDFSPIRGQPRIRFVSWVFDYSGFRALRQFGQDSTGHILDIDSFPVSEGFEFSRV
jgi:hypothetical protein